MNLKTRIEESNGEKFISGWTCALEPGAGAHEERHLSQVDPRLGLLIARVTVSGGRRRYQPLGATTHFDAIARSIVYQQLSKKAAATIYARYVDVLAGDSRPERVIATSAEALRSAGLSAPKVRYLKALASAVTSGDLDLHRLGDLPDDAVVESLTRIPGVGIWTAQMFLMFHLHRPDILPTHDVGIRRGLQIAHGLRKPAAPGYIGRAGRKWAPYRSLACLYLWAAVDLEMGRTSAT